MPNINISCDLLFQIKGNNITENEIAVINNLRNIRDRILSIYNNGAYLELIEFKDQLLNDKLILIDSYLPKILAHALIIHYKYNLSNFSAVSNQLSITNPLNYNQSLGHKFYEYKLKKLIIEELLEIMPNAWAILYATQNSDNRNIFEDNLLKITFLNTLGNLPSEIGKIYISNQKLVIKLNLQIRFK